MDRSFLSQPEVIAASRRFVCVRLMTYENAEEGRFLKSLVRTGSGELENSVFAILAADGQTPLARPARSPRQTFGTAERMAAGMTRIADEVPGRPVSESPALPTVTNVRLAVDVAACDNLPLVVVFAPDVVARRELEDRIRPLAWGKRFLGRFTYVSAGSAEELASVTGAKPEAGVLVVQSERFGRSSKVLKQVSASATPDELAWCLTDSLARFQGEAKSFGTHVRDGHQTGVFWETKIPVTDPMELQARERGRKKR
jgi:hypothetical protein